MGRGERIPRMERGWQGREIGSLILWAFQATNPKSLLGWARPR